MTHERKKIIEKIKKLFNVNTKRGSTEAEAVSAALAAQRLIVENDVEQWELDDENEPIVSVASPNTRIWQDSLANVVASNFRCRMYCASNGTRQCFEFFGYKNDAEAAATTYEHLAKACASLASDHARQALQRMAGPDASESCRKSLRRKHRQHIVNAFALAFAEGVESELAKQSQALMIVCPPTVNDAYAELVKNWQTKKAESTS
ncbi:DUF7168 domain-containing protein [Xiamenia xianingshaonis]|uniref:DUF2786 domain-containing protein n=1 Tax=Xiamenia xianingshaonis TaxID=2682776 RepID=A0ABX0IFW1_9ACTN|nr:DUF2786 domain-containing protein [Xiamenia xianingshaonis]NHM13505.1 DUF2786 domain-containing protein [Xiamenia xianingshaonis]